MIDTRVSAFTGLVVILKLIASWLYEVAQGGDGSPYAQLCAIAGLAYVVAVAWLRWRG